MITRLKTISHAKSYVRKLKKYSLCEKHNTDSEMTTTSQKEAISKMKDILIGLHEKPIEERIEGVISIYSYIMNTDSAIDILYMNPHFYSIVLEKAKEFAEYGDGEVKVVCNQFIRLYSNLGETE